MKKPERIYEEKWYIVVAYGDFDLRENPYHIPATTITNFGISEYDPEVEDLKLVQTVYEQFEEWATDSGHNADDYPDWLKKKPRYVYFCKMPDSDKLVELQDLMDHIIEPNSLMSLEEYNLFITYLPRMRELLIPIPQ